LKGAQIQEINTQNTIVQNTINLQNTGIPNIANLPNAGLQNTINLQNTGIPNITNLPNAGLQNTVNLPNTGIVLNPGYTGNVGNVDSGDEIIKLREENNFLKNELQKANQMINNLKNEKNQQGLYTNNQIKLKEDEINKLKIELEKLKIKEKDKLINFDDIIIISFTSEDKIIDKYPIKCLKTDTFAEVEQKLYQKYDNFRDTNNIFILNEVPILRFKTLSENNIKDGDILKLIRNK
jgi:hypothetical protein